LSTPAGSSQDELSLLEFERSSTPPNRSSSSSEDPKTELSTLQDSLRDVLLRSAAAQGNDGLGHLLHDIALQTKLPWIENPERVTIESETGKEMVVNEPEVELNDSLLEIMKKRHEDKICPLPKEADVVAKSVKSPDLEEIPLPCLPKPDEPVERKTRLEGPKLETIIESLQSPPDTEGLETCQPIKKHKLLTNIDPNWGNIPIHMPKPVLPPKPELLRKPERPESKNQETLTENSDFNLWRSNGIYTIILTTPRVITDANTPVPVRCKTQIVMFDKSTTTDDLQESSAGLQDLISMFPHVPEHDLADLYEKCSQDVQWVAELITDSNFENLEGKSIAPEPFEKPVEPVLEAVITDGKKTIKRKKEKKNGSNSELSQILKKGIESSFQIGTEHYSDHVLLIKKLKEGEITMDSPICDNAPEWEGEKEEIVASGAPTQEAEDTIPMPLDPVFFQHLLSKFEGPGNGFRDFLVGKSQSGDSHLNSKSCYD